MNRNDKKQLAQDLYLNTDYSQKQIALAVGVAEKTLSEWARKGQWKELRGALTLTPERVLRNLYRQAEFLSEQSGSDFNADKIAKLAVSIERMKPSQLTISSHINALKAFTRWLVNVDGDMARKLAPHMQEFIDEQMTQHGG